MENAPAPDSTLISQPLKSNNKIMLIGIAIIVLCCCCFGILGISLISLEIFSEALGML